MDPEREKQLQAELEILQKPNWGWSDIKGYYHCASEKANNIRKRALENGGACKYQPHKVKADVVLLVEDDTTVEKQIRNRTIELSGGAIPEEQQPKQEEQKEGITCQNKSDY